MARGSSQLMGGLLAGGVYQRNLKLMAGARQRGHYRADGNRSDGRNLLVRTPFQLAQHDYFAEARWQSFERPGKPVAIVAGDRESLRRNAVRQVLLFVEFRRRLRGPILFQPGETSVAHDLQQPGTRIAAMKAAEKTIGAQHGLLSNVLGIGAVAHQPTRQVEG